MGQFYRHQDVRADGRAVVLAQVAGPAGRTGRDERHLFATPQEAAERAAAIAESLSWIGTPFLDCGFVKGPDGCVDCAMKLVGTYSAAVPDKVKGFDPRPYPPRWFQHRGEERFLDCLQALGAREVEKPRVGDVLVYRFGRTYAHGAVLINSAEVCHAYASARGVVVSGRDEPLLQFIGWRGQSLPRPVRAFSIWGDPPC